MNTLILKYTPNALVNKAISLLVSIKGVKIEHTDDEAIFNDIDMKMAEKSLKSGIATEAEFEKAFNEALSKAK